MLDQRGDIDATILAVYIPVAFLSVFLIFRYGLKNGGSSWIYLTVFAASENGPLPYFSSS